MNQATNVNIVPSYGQRGDLHFSQYDVGRTATINLYAVNEAYTIPVGATVKIQATKPSGLGFDVACTFSGSVVTVVSTETMTAEAGRFPCELRITKDSDVIGTANFMFCVEASPHPDGVIDGDAEEVVNEIKALVLQSEGFALGTQDGVPVDSSSPYYHNNAKWLSDNAVLSDEVKQTLLACFEKVAWIDANGQTYYNALQSALNRGAELLSISAVYTQSGTVYSTDSLDSLKTDLVVTAHYDDQTTEEVLAYTLSGSLMTDGTTTITVSYSGKTATFTVNVTWSTGITEFFACNATMDVSNGVVTKIYTQSNNKRASINPAAIFMPTGTYTVSCPSAYYFGMMFATDNESSPSLMSTNFTNDGTAKTFWEGTATRDINNSGWQNSSYTIQIDRDVWSIINFKVGSAGTTAFTSSDLATLLANFSITKDS